VGGQRLHPDVRRLPARRRPGGRHRRRRLLFLVGVGLFSGASLAGGLAPSSGWLVGARAVQGLGGALLSPAALSLLTVTFAHGRERNVALGIWGALAGLGGTLGVVAGGLLVDGAGWEWCSSSTCRSGWR
jgi:MFS family permease